jgi:hypothetical protein
MASLYAFIVSSIRRTSACSMIGDCSPGLGVRAAALAALLRVRERLLVGALGDREPLDADPEPGVVHHREHAAHAGVRLADEVADRTLALLAVGHHARRGRVDAELVLERDAGDVVALAERTVVVHEELRHDEQRDPLVPGGRVGQPGQDQVDDVVGQLVLAEGDVDLLAGDPVGAVVLRDGLGGDRADVRAGLRLGEVHRPGPLAGDHLRQVGLLLLLGGVVGQQVDRTGRQQRAERERHVRAGDHLLDGVGDEQREAAAAELGRVLEGPPAGLDVLVVDLLEGGGQHHLLALEPGTLEVAVAVGRRDRPRRRTARPPRAGRRRARGRRGRTGSSAVSSAERRHVLEDEADVTERGGVGRHGPDATAGARSPGPSGRGTRTVCRPAAQS